MAEGEGVVGVFLASLLFNCLLGLFDLGEEDDDESYHEDGQGNHQGRSGIGNLGLGGIADECTHDDIDCHSCSGVEYAAGLDELVALVATTAEEVEHGVHDRVEDAHAAAGDEGTDEIDGHAAPTREPLDDDTRDTDGEAKEGRLLVAVLLNTHASGETHHQVSHEVAIVADHSHEVGGSKLVFHDNAHG